MEDEENSQGTETHVYRVEEFNTDLSSPSRSCSNINKQSHIIVSSNGNIIPVSSHVIVTSGGQFTLSNNKSIDLIGEEFVSKLKSEPEQDEDKRSPVVMSIASMNTETNTVSAGGEQSHLVYCNLNDLDLSGSGETYSLASLHSLAEASSTVQQQERNSYSNVSTILLQGGILQVQFNTTFSIKSKQVTISIFFLTINKLRLKFNSANCKLSVKKLSNMHLRRHLGQCTRII